MGIVSEKNHIRPQFAGAHAMQLAYLVAIAVIL